MKKLTLTISGNTYFDPEIIIDNKKLKPIKKKNVTKIYYVETDKDELDIEIGKWYELNSKYWLVTFIFFFIISCFGLFDLKQPKKYVDLNYKGTIKLINEESNLKLGFGKFKEGEKAFNSDGNCQISDNESNIYVLDKELEKRAKILKNIKKYTWISLGVISIVAIVLILVL